MSSTLRQGLLESITITALLLLLTSVVVYAGTITYTYDELNRLKQVDYGDGTIIQYIYDNAGNRTTVYVNTTPPTSTASPPGGAYNSTQSVTLTCTDWSGSGCDKIYYTTDGTDPSTLSPVYSSPINISVTTTLKFFAKDLAGNSEQPFKSETYTIDTTPPSNPTACNESHGAPDNAWQNSVSTPVFTWSGASDTGSGISGYYWYFGTDPNGVPATWTTNQGCSPSAVTTGTYYLRVKTKDNAGNVSSAVTLLYTFKYDGTAPSTTPSPAGGSFGSAQSVTLNCTDQGSGYDKIYYTTDGTNPTTSSSVYSAPLYIMVTTTLKYFCRDLAGNSEPIQSQTYTISYNGCSNPPVQIGSTFYTTLQDAYNSANNGNTIKARAWEFVENLAINRSVTVTLQGGYDCQYSTYSDRTSIKGTITTSAGVGTITIGNVILEQ
jgi:YD repeat-containing protein